ncbi:hypothetical protein C273_10437 [Staphylococcus massiliensis S46]|uniref:Uncharacterized protein n=1 Tax=Staphylococcus massiliensis S46 TaxID=1229783 RepID=K9AII9_9STAP|nr:hypothetical protein C273_10437 [Staphylococcus massiliensis S46]
MTHYMDFVTKVRHLFFNRIGEKTLIFVLNSLLQFRQSFDDLSHIFLAQSRQEETRFQLVSKT